MTTSSIINQQHHSPDPSPPIDYPLIHHQTKGQPKTGPLETAVLKLHFEKNRFPSDQEKELIVKKLHDSLGSQMAVQQLDHWFENERSSSSKSSHEQISKKAYRKFAEEDVKLLQTNFEKNNYPNVEEMKMMAEQFGVELIKIENWYKHHRRSLAKRGQFDIKTKKHFKSDELNYLMEIFHKQSKPTHEQIQIIAQNINCTPYQIKNWFSNKRKKLKFLTKNQTPSTETSQTIFQNQNLTDGSYNPSPNFSSLLKPPSETCQPSLFSLGSQSPDSNDQTRLPLVSVNFPGAYYNETQNLRGPLASFSSSITPSQDFLQEISRLQSLQGGIRPPNFFETFQPITSFPLCSQNFLNSQAFTYSSPSAVIQEFPSKTFGKPQIELLQSEAIKALNAALSKNTSQSLTNITRFAHNNQRPFPE